MHCMAPLSPREGRLRSFHDDDDDDDDNDDERCHMFVLSDHKVCLLYTSPSPRDRQKSRMPSSA